MPGKMTYYKTASLPGGRPVFFNHEAVGFVLPVLTINQLIAVSNINASRAQKTGEKARLFTGE